MKSYLSFVLEAARLWQAFEGKWSVGWGGGGEIRCVREKERKFPGYSPSLFHFKLLSPRLWKNRLVVPKWTIRYSLVSIFLDSLSFGVACSGRSDNRERTKMGREENENEGREREERERSHDALPSPPSAFPCFLYPAPLPTIWTLGTGYLRPFFVSHFSFSLRRDPFQLLRELFPFFSFPPPLNKVSNMNYLLTLLRVYMISMSSYKVFRYSAGRLL